MKRSVFILVFTIFAAFAAPAQVNVGMTDTASYYPLLRGRRVAVLANQTSVAELPGAPGADASGRVHLVDLLHGEGFAVAAIFSPEHGFRGTADAGEQVASSVDARTGIPIRSLYDGNAKRPSDEAMRSFDVLVVDMQDVGLRFYTYYISMLRMMDACADFGRLVVVLDRPNPNGHLVDGPVLDMKYKSGVGAHLHSAVRERLQYQAKHGVNCGDHGAAYQGLNGQFVFASRHKITLRRIDFDRAQDRQAWVGLRLKTRRSLKS